jgi:outer membrane protein TolC
LAAQTAELDAQGELDVLCAARREEVYALAALLDEPPEQYQPVSVRLPARPLPPVPSGLPIQILDRRGDLRAARSRLDAALHTLDAAEAARYPQLNLTAGVDAISQELGQILSNPVGTVGASVLGPFLDWKGQKLARDSQVRKYEEAVVEFREKLYEALKDVELAFGRQKDDRNAIARAEQLLQVASDRATQTELRYQLGVKSRQDWLTERSKQHAAEMDLLQKRGAELDDWIAVRKALGGT